MGVTMGFAGVKFSGSPKRSGVNRTRYARRAVNTVYPNKSLEVWYQWKGTFLGFLLIPRGLLDPVW